MLQISVNTVGQGGTRTIAIFSIDDEDPKAKPQFDNAPDVKTSALIRKCLDFLDAEAESFKKS